MSVCASVCVHGCPLSSLGLDLLDVGLAWVAPCGGGCFPLRAPSCSSLLLLQSGVPLAPGSPPWALGWVLGAGLPALAVRGGSVSLGGRVPPRVGSGPPRTRSSRSCHRLHWVAGSWWGPGHSLRVLWVPPPAVVRALPRVLLCHLLGWGGACWWWSFPSPSPGPLWGPLVACVWGSYMSASGLLGGRVPALFPHS